MRGNAVNFQRLENEDKEIADRYPTKAAKMEDVC